MALQPKFQENTLFRCIWHGTERGHKPRAHACSLMRGRRGRARVWIRNQGSCRGRAFSLELLREGYPYAVLGNTALSSTARGCFRFTLKRRARRRSMRSSLSTRKSTDFRHSSEATLQFMSGP